MNLVHCWGHMLWCAEVRTQLSGVHSFPLQHGSQRLNSDHQIWCRLFYLVFHFTCTKIMYFECFNLLLSFLSCVRVFMHILTCGLNDHEGHNRAQNPLGLKLKQLQANKSGLWYPNLGSLEEQKAHLNIEPSHQFLKYVYMVAEEMSH